MAGAIVRDEDRTMAPVVPSFEGLIGQAIQAGASVETMEKLLDMRERLRQEQARTAYFEALSAFQEECPSVPKTKAADRYKYAPLDVIVATMHPYLRHNGLSYRFDTQFEAQPPAQLVTCTVTHVGGHSETSTFRTPIDANARINDMQKSASAQTYAKRYALCNALGIVTADEDDDGRGAYSPPPAPPHFERREPRPIPRGGVVTLPSSDPDPASDPVDEHADLRQTLVGLATEVVVRRSPGISRQSAPKQEAEGRRFVQRFVPGLPFDEWPEETLTDVEEKLRKKLDEAPL